MRNTLLASVAAVAFAVASPVLASNVSGVDTNQNVNDQEFLNNAPSTLILSAKDENSNGDDNYKKKNKDKDDSGKDTDDDDSGEDEDDD